jgi:hypothetical protein
VVVLPKKVKQFFRRHHAPNLMLMVKKA